MPTEERRPLVATYRVQLNAGFNFDEAAGIADYLADLGISHLYCSPYLQAAPGSTHGYDVVDPGRVNAELGGAAGHARLSEALARRGLAQVLDVVPNHMAISSRENLWWWDLLENGPSSRYASYFDVDWDPPESKLRNTVLLPILGDHYGRVLEAGEFRLERQGGSFVLGYGDHQLPVALVSVRSLLASAAERCGSDRLAFIAESLGRLPLSTVRDRGSVERRHRDKEVLRQLLERQLQEEPALAAAIDDLVTGLNRNPDTLDSLLEAQNYRLAYWRTAGSELDYRRFFDINTLVGLCVEDEQVLASTHSLVLRWLGEGVLGGLRIDHPDGLRDPEQYFQRLRALAPRAWIVAEKILEPGERLPQSWPVAGTTGYDFLNCATGLLIDPAGEEPLNEIYSEFTGQSIDYRMLVREKKHQVLKETLGSDVNRLASLFVSVCERQRRYRDYTRPELREVLREMIACFPVYRTYVRADSGLVSEEDQRVINRAVEAAKMFRPDLDSMLFDFFRDLLLLKIPGSVETELVMRFQQLTGPAMAKGVEDTAFYCFNRLVALNEVGGDPGRFGVSVEEFHQACLAAEERWPLTMLCTSTHDTKRSEDVRARLALLSEIPRRWWSEAVARWSARNERHRQGGLPDRNSEYLLYQTLVGAWPIDLERAAAYMEKSSREAKVHTSWTDPRPEYDRALRGFVEGVMRDPQFIEELAAFVKPLVEPGRINSLAQTLLKLTAPGVPDIYQGMELWTLSLVDPDNRRPVDYQLRRRLLKELQGLAPDEIWARLDQGLPKMHLIRQALALRARRPELFGPEGGYHPLAARGPKAAHLVAFRRGEDAITLVPRLVLGLGGDWQGTAIDLGGGRWRDEITGLVVENGEVPLSLLLGTFPVALLSREP
jgi:(1->4)-alpha-D-glucan 1-alpha-D-glucosylmutase